MDVSVSFEASSKKVTDSDYLLTLQQPTPYLFRGVC